MTSRVALKAWGEKKKSSEHIRLGNAMPLIAGSKRKRMRRGYDLNSSEKRKGKGRRVTPPFWLGRQISQWKVEILKKHGNCERGRSEDQVPLRERSACRESEAVGAREVEGSSGVSGGTQKIPGVRIAGAQKRGGGVHGCAKRAKGKEEDFYHPG